MQFLSFTIMSLFCERNGRIISNSVFQVVLPLHAIELHFDDNTKYNVSIVIGGDVIYNS
jgi:hypothetical protein